MSNKLYLVSFCNSHKVRRMRLSGTEEGATANIMDVERSEQDIKYGKQSWENHVEKRKRNKTEKKITLIIEVMI